MWLITSEKLIECLRKTVGTTLITTCEVVHKSLVSFENAIPTVENRKWAWINIARKYGFNCVWDVEEIQRRDGWSKIEAWCRRSIRHEKKELEMKLK